MTHWSPVLKLPSGSVSGVTTVCSSDSGVPLNTAPGEVSTSLTARLGSIVNPATSNAFRMIRVSLVRYVVTYAL